MDCASATRRLDSGRSAALDSHVGPGFNAHALFLSEVCPRSFREVFGDECFTATSRIDFTLLFAAEVHSQKSRAPPFDRNDFRSIAGSHRDSIAVAHSHG